MAQGRNQAMEDAMALAPVIEACLKRADFSRETLLITSMCGKSGNTDPSENGR
jgi:hypothetical protein